MKSKRVKTKKPKHVDPSSPQGHRNDYAARLRTLADNIEKGADMSCVVAYAARNDTGLSFEWRGFYGAMSDINAITLLRGSLAHACTAVDRQIDVAVQLQSAPPPVEEPTPSAFVLE